MGGLSRGTAKLLVALVVAAIVVVGVRFFLSRATSDEGQATKMDASSTSAPTEIEKLIGRWRRPDGGYIMAIRGADAEGNMQVEYYNPKPINVSKAHVTREKEWLQVFVELTDVGYPGATYNLTYDPHHDILKGSYYQPTHAQSFEVEFVRIH